MIWADKLAVVAAIVLLGFLALMAKAVWSADFLDLYWEVAIRTVIPLWIGLRVLDWLAGGPSRRGGRIKATVLPPR